MEKPQSRSASGSDHTRGGETPTSGGSLWALVVGGAILALAGYLVFGVGPDPSEKRGNDGVSASGQGSGANSGPRARRADSALGSRASSPAVERATTELASAAGAAALPDAPKSPEARTDALVEKLEKFKTRLTELEASLAKHDTDKAKFIASYPDASVGESKWKSQRDAFEKSITAAKKQISATEALLEAE
jgi:hypothetical protein